VSSARKEGAAEVWYDSRQYDPRLRWLPMTRSTPIAAAALSIASEASLCGANTCNMLTSFHHTAAAAHRAGMG